MKLNYKNTCLHFLDQPEKMDFFLPDSNKNLSKLEQLAFAQSVKGMFKDLACKESEFLRQKVRLLTRPFLEAYEKGKSKLIDVFAKEEFEETGVFLTQLSSFTNTYFYYLKTYIEDGEWRVDWCLMVFTKHTHAELPGLDAFFLETKKVKKSFIWKEWDDKGMDAIHWLGWLVCLPIFLKYCPMETKMVKGGGKEKHVGEKYVNETKYAVEILDSTWFTTIIRSEGFGVSGHFRKQRYGPGMTEWRLQYIEPFEKTGYTRKAKVLIHQNKSQK
jgi:hypothetical protein